MKQVSARMRAQYWGSEPEQTCRNVFRAAGRTRKMRDGLIRERLYDMVIRAARARARGVPSESKAPLIESPRPEKYRAFPQESHAFIPFTRTLYDLPLYGVLKAHRCNMASCSVFFLFFRWPAACDATRECFVYERTAYRFTGLLNFALYCLAWWIVIFMASAWIKREFCARELWRVFTAIVFMCSKCAC